MPLKIIQSFINAGNDNASPSRRRFPRRTNDICVLSIGQNTYPVHDWSQCGVLFEADGKYFEQNKSLEAVLKFRTEGTVTDIKIEAKIVRSGKTRVAFEFINTSDDIEATFSDIIKHAESFHHAYNTNPLSH